MLRPRESRDLRLISVDIATAPIATLTWAHDVFGNAVAMAHFSEPADTLTIQGNTVLDLNAHPWPVFDIAASALRFPFAYADDERIDLGALAVQQHPDPTGRLRAWAAGFVRGPQTDTLSLLKDLAAGVSAHITYQIREEEGTQAPLETLDRGQGTCRDFAVLLAEAARTLGFGARLVSGYLFVPSGNVATLSSEGSTHAWTEIYLPGAGWITFDPTNRSIGGFNLIPVAVARDITQIAPVVGSYLGPADAFADMAVTVSVTVDGGA